MYGDTCHLFQIYSEHFLTNLEEFGNSNFITDSPFSITSASFSSIYCSKLIHICCGYWRRDDSNVTSRQNCTFTSKWNRCSPDGLSEASRCTLALHCADEFRFDAETLYTKLHTGTHSRLSTSLCNALTRTCPNHEEKTNCASQVTHRTPHHLRNTPLERMERLDVTTWLRCNGDYLVFFYFNAKKSLHLSHLRPPPSEFIIVFLTYLITIRMMNIFPTAICELGLDRQKGHFPAMDKSIINCELKIS